MCYKVDTNVCARIKIMTKWGQPGKTSNLRSEQGRGEDLKK